MQHRYGTVQPHLLMRRLLGGAYGLGRALAQRSLAAAARLQLVCARCACVWGGVSLTRAEGLAERVFYCRKLHALRCTAASIH